MQSLSALGCLGLLIVAAIFYATSALFWTWVLMLCLGAAGLDWSFGHALIPWGLLIPLVLG